MAIDTAVFVYLIEEHPVFLPVVWPVLQAVDHGRITAVTSAVTLLETLVVPFRSGDEALAGRYEALLTRSRGLDMVPIDQSLLRAAAFLRAGTRTKTPDALQLAAALRRGCSTFVTNDRRLPPIRGLDILQLSDFAS